MGRTEKSQGLAPPAIRKDIRAKQARQIINKVIPSILASNVRARRGTDTSELITDPEPALGKETKKSDEGGEDAAYVKRKGPGRRKAKEAPDTNSKDQLQPRQISKKSGKRRNDSLKGDLSSLTLDANSPIPTPPPKPPTIRVIMTDSLTAAQILSTASKKPFKKAANVCVLNMASPLRPGGGVLLGATSQEEVLCARTSLLPSLKESFYRLPELGGVFTHDVLVFRNAGPLDGPELGVAERFYIDVISAGMLRFPDLEGGEDEVKRLSVKDRRVVENKMRAVLRIAEAKGVKKLVLGAWGCGAYGNPIVDVAEAWSMVLTGEVAKKGTAKAGETWSLLKEIVFAIPNPRMARELSDAFGGVEIEDGLYRFDEEDEEGDEEDRVAQELRAKIVEVEGQISKVWNADLKSRLVSVLNGLKEQLRDGQGEDGGSEEDGVRSGADEMSLNKQDDLAGGDDNGRDVDTEELDSVSDYADSIVAAEP